MALERLDQKSARALSCFLILVAMPLMYFIFPLGKIFNDVYQSERYREEHGIKVEGTISGFVEWKGPRPTKKYHRAPGFYPEISYSTPNGQMKIVGNPGHPIPEEKQAEMLGEKHTVIYLPENPKNAVVLDWNEDHAPSLLPVFLFFILITLLVIGIALKVWRKRIRA